MSSPVTSPEQEPRSIRSGVAEPGRAPLLWWAAAFWMTATGLQTLILVVQEGLPWVIALGSAIVTFALLALLGVPTWYLCTWLSRQPRPWWQLVAVHVGFAAAVVAVWQLVFMALLRFLGGPIALSEFVSGGGLWAWLQAALLYIVMLSGMLLVQSSRRLARQQRREADLRLHMREAELRALRAQLRPHFLFNTLNSIYSLVATEPQKAERMVALLSGLLRDTLELGDRTLVELSEEMQLVERYLEIESVRFEDRLEVVVDVDRAAGSALVPPFLLQPVVENSVRHGIAPSEAGGTIAVTATCNNGTLEIDVRDDGCGLTANDPLDGGDGLGGRAQSGLRITRSRLENLFGDRCRLELSAEPRGCRVLLTMPARFETAAADDLSAEPS